jgi:rhamnogalacturonan endolyase
MGKKYFLLSIILLTLLFSCSDTKVGEEISSERLYSDEAQAVLGRGVVSYLRGQDQVLSWRLLPEDPKGVSFSIYRKEIGSGEENYKLIARSDRTSYTDRDARGRRYAYAVRQLQEKQEGKFSRESIALSSIGGKAALVFDLGQPYKQARVVTGDLNGDGEPEVVIAYSGYQNVDPYEKARTKSEDSIKVSAFLATGERLWTLDLGWGIEAGMNFQPMVVSDLDGDGRAEVILKTNKSANPLDYEGERITVLDGMSGRIKMEAKWPSLKGLGSDYNNDSRNYLAIAHLDGKDPYVIAVRGLYKVQRMWAFDKNLNRVWERNLGLDHYYPSGIWGRLIKFWNIDDKMEYILARFKNKPILDEYRGSHSLPVADINEDGKEEILWGERCIGENGKDLWAIKKNMPYRGHPDVVRPAKILPSLKGKQIFYGREGWYGKKNENIGVYLVDSQGKILWAKWGYTHIDMGWVGKIVPGQEGMQCLGIDIMEKQWNKQGAKVIDPSGFLWGSGGNLLGNPQPSWYYSFPVDWDGDGIRNICIMEEGVIQKYGETAIIEKLPAECLWGADLFGDHREEIVSAPGDGKIYIFFNTGDFKGSPRVTPMADRQYKNDLSRTAMHAFVFPTEGGFIPRKSR